MAAHRSQTHDRRLDRGAVLPIRFPPTMTTPATGAHRHERLERQQRVIDRAERVCAATTTTGSPSFAMRSTIRSSSFSGTSTPPAPSTTQRSAAGSAAAIAIRAIQIDLNAAQSRGQMRRKRPRKPNALVEHSAGGASGQPLNGGGVVVFFDAGLDRLPVTQRGVRGTGATSPRRRRSCRRRYLFP